MACKKPRFNTTGFLALELHLYLKEMVYAENPQTIQELKQAISDAISQIPNQMVRNATQSVTRRAQKIVEVL